MAARSSGESSQNHHQNRSTIEVIRDDSDIGCCNTGRGGHTIEASSIFHGGFAGAGDSAGIPSKNFENQYEEEMRVISQTQIQHREGKQQVQDLGQSSTSHKDEQLTTKQGKDTGIICIDKSHSTVIHAHQAHLNAGTDRNENDQMKIWVAKDQGKDTGKQMEEPDDEQVNKGNKVKVPPDDYGAFNSEDEIDPDNQSMEESDEDAEVTMKHTGQVLVLF
uniref:Uncharacterized protein n=1 Tax=Solanum tuberosum TaxID=4113 RepID=M1DGL1_SOLTU